MPTSRSRLRKRRVTRQVMGIAMAGSVLITAGCTADTGQAIQAEVPRTTDTTRAAYAETTAESLWALGADLERALAEQEPRTNTVLAPVAVALGLAEATAGAGGNTREQLTAALHAGAGFDQGLDAVWLALPTRSGEQQEPASGRKGRVSVGLASTLWGQRDTEFGDAWLTTLAETWGTGVRVTDFRSDPEEARRAINEWAASATDDQITQLLSRGATDELTRFIATSASYLKAPWKAPFSLSDTRLMDFHRLDGSLVSVPMMRAQDLEARVADGDGWQAVELPYLGDQLRMTIVMPDEGRFAEIERAFDGAGLVDLLDSLRVAAVDLSVPRFGFTSDLELDDALRANGVVDAFDRSTADFAAVTADEPLALAGVVHQTFLAIDEEGTEAVGTAPQRPPSTDAATTIPAVSDTAVAAGAAPGQPAATTGPTRPFLIDRPFLVLVTDQGTGAPLFYGRVVSPRD